MELVEWKGESECGMLMLNSRLAGRAVVSRQRSVFGRLSVTGAVELGSLVISERL